MTDEKERRINPRSLENLKLGAEARYQGKVRRNTTLLPETIEWLEGRGNVSEMIDQLVAAAKSASLKASDMGQSNNTHESTHQQTEPEPSSNHTHESIIEGGIVRWNVYESVEGYDREQKKNAWGEWKLVASYKTEYEADTTIASREEHNHRLNSARDYGIVGLRFEKRNEVIAPADGISVTPTAKELLAEVQQLRAQLMEVRASNETLEAEVKKWVQSSAQAQYQLDDVIAERDNARSQLEDMAASSAEWYEKASLCNQQLQNSRALLPDLDAVRDRILQSLKLGKQAPEYKRTKAILERFIHELQQQ